MFESILFWLLVLPGSLSMKTMKNTESLSLAPTHPCTIISYIGDLKGWWYDDMKNDHIAQN